MSSLALRLATVSGRGSQFAALCGLLIASTGIALATPEATYIYPAGGPPGAAVEATVGGKFPQWPVVIESTSRAVTVEPLEEKGKVKITVAEDASPGPVWLRIYDDAGAALPRPWIVDDAKTVIETEDNDQPEAAQHLPLDEGPAATIIVDGRLEKNGDVDVYQIDLPVGNTLVANIDANTELASPMDGVLQVLRPDGFVAAQNDDQHGLDPRLAVPIEQAGAWKVRVFGFPAAPNQAIQLGGGEDYVYRLTLSTGPVVHHALPLAAAREKPTEFALHGWNLPDNLPPLVLTADPAQTRLRLESDQLARTIAVDTFAGAVLVEPEGTSLDEPADVTLPVSVTGRIELHGDEDAYRFAGKKGEVISVGIASRSLGYAMDPVVRLLDQAGKELARVDDVGANRDAELTHTIAADGPLRVVASDLFGHGGEHFVYRLAIEKVDPDFALTSANHQWTVKAGETVDVEIGVVRRSGFSEPVEVAIEGLPNGVTAAAQTSAPGKDSTTADKVVLKVVAAADASPASAGLQIVGKSASGVAVPARFDAPAHKEGLTQFWLTVTK